jgi:hypothetical protein
MEEKKVSKMRKKILKAYEENEYAHVLQNRNRARSFTVGTSFGGVVEVSMRGDHHSLWCTLQPVEAIEFIEQLAAATGIQVALRPKNDFSSWRGWDIENADRYWVGSASWNTPRLSDKESNKSLLLSEVSEEVKKMVKDVQEEYVNGNKDTEEIRDKSAKKLSKKYKKKCEEEQNMREKLSSEAIEEISKNKIDDIEKYREDLHEDIAKYVEENDLT